MNVRAAVLWALPCVTSAQAPERVPFVEGLTTVRVSVSPVGDYETLRTLGQITEQGFTLHTVGQALADSGDKLVKIDLKRRVRAEDQLHSRNVRIEWHSSDRESMTGNVPGLSCDLFNELRASGKAKLTYVGLESRLSGTVSVVDRKTFTMLVNRAPTPLPALHARGTLSGDGETVPFDFHVLDDEDNPMLLRASFGIQDGRVTAIDYPPAGRTLERKLAAEQPMELGGIYFEFARAELKPQSEPALVELASVLRAHPDWRFHIDGHTDSVGDDAANRTLSTRRAEAVRTALTGRLGLPAAQFDARGFGETRPRETNDSVSGRARNRRVELVRIGAPAPARQTPEVSGEAMATSACRFSANR